MEIGIGTIGALHPNKKGASFRELVSDSVAFNAVAKSNLLLAEHPDDEDRRVVVVGKGKFARKPQSFEFNLGTLMFTANDERFEVPNVQDIQFGELAVEDLVGSEPEKVDHSQVGQASSMIRLKLPVDGQWHLARPIIDACAEEGLSERTVKRAKVKLGLGQQNENGAR